jgi:hypothetical protein
MLRYLLLDTHDWTDEVIERLLGEVRPPSPEDETMVHQILTEMRSGESGTKRSGGGGADTPVAAARSPGRPAHGEGRPP